MKLVELGPRRFKSWWEQRIWREERARIDWSLFKTLRLLEPMHNRLSGCDNAQGPKSAAYKVIVRSGQNRREVDGKTGLA